MCEKSYDAWEDAQNKLETRFDPHVLAKLASAFADEFESPRVRCA